MKSLVHKLLISFGQYYFDVGNCKEIDFSYFTARQPFKNNLKGVSNSEGFLFCIPRHFVNLFTMALITFMLSIDVYFTSLVSEDIEGRNIFVYN